MTQIILRNNNGKEIYRHSQKDNTNKITVRRAIKLGACLTNADLSNMDLQGLVLWHTDLTRVDFSKSNLKGANFFHSELTGACFTMASLEKVDMRGANLSKAGLTGCNLKGTRISKAVGNGGYLKNLHLPVFTVVMTKHAIAIGCKQYTSEQWHKFNDYVIGAMSYDRIATIAWWHQWKDFILCGEFFNEDI